MKCLDCDCEMEILDEENNDILFECPRCGLNLLGKKENETYKKT